MSEKKIGRPKKYLTEQEKIKAEKQSKLLRNQKYYLKTRIQMSKTPAIIYKERLIRINEMYINMNQLCCDCLSQKKHELTAPYCSKCWGFIVNGNKKINISHIVPKATNNLSEQNIPKGGYSFGCNCEDTFCHC